MSEDLKAFSENIRNNVTPFPSMATQEYHLQHKIRSSKFALRNRICSWREREDNRQLHSQLPLAYVESCQSDECYI
jgi:hypothetical protein